MKHLLASTAIIAALTTSAFADDGTTPREDDTLNITMAIFASRECSQINGIKAAVLMTFVKQVARNDGFDPDELQAEALAHYEENRLRSPDHIGPMCEQMDRIALAVLRN
ncbi:hypothetical protein [Rhizobium mayense]|uniref:Uncharacterized protein n=1 Tax=Rhizobium mayense TaxID=1312184 RepID=A0ABT7JRT4_9HYPH|nr:hypothetical protein [Rhizobium mayense]MDL2398435.1 hypothetical protein [Rhizobium mayense]